MKKEIPVLGFVVGLLILIRWLFTNSTDIVYIVASINVIAIIFVIYSIVWKIISGVHDRIDKSGVPEEIQQREKRRISTMIWSWVIGVSVILTVLYFCFCCSGLGNDIIAIIALGISVLDNQITDLISNKLYI